MLAPASVIDQLLTTFGYFAVFMAVGIESLGIPLRASPRSFVVAGLVLYVRGHADRLASQAEQAYPGPLSDDPSR